MLVATQQTAKYTHDLTTATLMLFAGTIIALVVGEFQRRAGLKDAERARREQYDQDKTLNEAAISDLKEDRANQARLRDDEAERRRLAGLAQLITILQAYQRAINLLLMAPQYPIAAHARTMESLLTHALSDSVVSVIPPDLRNRTITAIIKAQETLQASAENQGFYDSLRADLEREGIVATRFAERLTEASAEVERLQQRLAHEMDPKAQVTLQERFEESQRRFSSLKASPDAYDSTHFVATQTQRAEKLNAIYPTITANARDADKVLTAARAALGDNTDMTFVPQQPPGQAGNTLQ